jgi:hypothetical protein
MLGLEYGNNFPASCSILYHELGFQSQFWSNMEWKFSSRSREKSVVFPSIPQPLLFCCCALTILSLTPVTLIIEISHCCVDEPTT